MAQRTRLPATYSRWPRSQSRVKLPAPIPGITFFAAGSRDEGLTRPVNDQVFDVGLHVYFVDRAAHDVYQDHPGHIAFIEDNMANWKSVRVFDGGFAR